MSETHRSAIPRRVPSAPARRLHAENRLRGRTLDYGCGRGRDAMHFSMDRYDPHWFPEEPVGPYDTITCTYVLNVVPASDERDILDRIRGLLAPDGLAYITVRRDIEDGQVGRGCTQRLVHLDLPVLYNNADFCTYIVHGRV